jgi:DNA-directed RNA polymerase subunit RPC12/RpoP
MTASKTVTYKCIECGRTLECPVNDNAPECHGKKMKTLEELEGCTLTETAEHTRFENENQPCDDGRTG